MSTLKLSLVGIGLRLALMLVVMVNALLLARNLGPQRFGEYFLFLRVVSVLAVLADLGLSQSANAYFGRHQEWRGSIHRIILKFVPVFWLATATIVGITLWLTANTLLPHLDKLLIIGAFFVLPLSLYANLWNSMMIGMGRIWRVNLLQLALCSLSLTLTVIFVGIFSGGVMVAATIYFAVMLLQFFVMLFIAWRSDKEPLGNAPAGLAQEMLNFGLRGYLGSLSYLLWTRLPVFILNATHGAVAVGIFSIAQQMAEKIQLPVQAIQDVVYQKMSFLPGDEATLAMNLYIRLTWWGMIVVSLVGALLAPWVIVAMIGSAYVSAIGAVQILFAGVAFVGVWQLLDVYFVNQLHRPGLTSILAWVSVIMGMTLAVILIPPFAERGAAWAVALTGIFSSVVYVSLYLHITGTSTKALIYVRTNDVTMIKEQLAEILKPSNQLRTNE